MRIARAAGGKAVMKKARVYCLRCLRPLPGATDLRTVCDACGHLNFGPDRRRYWNQVPWVCALEATLKVGVVAITAAVIGYLLWTFRGEFYFRTLGYVGFLPALFGFKLWKTVELLTQRKPHAHPTVFWTAALALAAAGMFLIDLGSLRVVGRFGLAIVGVWAIAWAYRTWKHDLLRKIAA